MVLKINKSYVSDDSFDDMLMLVVRIGFDGSLDFCLLLFVPFDPLLLFPRLISREFS